MTMAVQTSQATDDNCLALKNMQQCSFGSQIKVIYVVRNAGPTMDDVCTGYCKYKQKRKKKQQQELLSQESSFYYIKCHLKKSIFFGNKQDHKNKCVIARRK